MVWLIGNDSCVCMVTILPSTFHCSDDTMCTTQTTCSARVVVLKKLFCSLRICPLVIVGRYVVYVSVALVLLSVLVVYANGVPGMPF